MNDFNSVVLLGNVYNNPIIYETGQAGRVVAKFVFQTNERYMSKTGEWKVRSSTMMVKAFGDLASAIRDHVSKGDRLHIGGYLQTDSYVDRKDPAGLTRYTTFVIVREMSLEDG